MSDATWYYSEGERQKGPISADELKRLVELERVKPTDLVWQPGMDDWVAAKTIRGLVPTDMAGESSTGSDVAGIDGGFENDDEILTRRRRRRSGFRWDSEILNRWGGRYARLIVFAGLIILLLGRGCDSVGSKFAKRQQILVDVAKADLDATYRQRRLVPQSRIDELQRKPLLSELDQKLLAGYRDDLLVIDRDYVQQQSQLSQTTWLDMDIASRSAAAKHMAWQPFYELAALVGSIVLAYGLLSVGFTGEPIERWGCWILLGILLASYVFWRTPT